LQESVIGNEQPHRAENDLGMSVAGSSLQAAARVVVSPYFQSSPAAAAVPAAADDRSEPLQVVESASQTMEAAAATPKRKRRRVAAEFVSSKKGSKKKQEPHPFANRGDDAKMDKARRVRKKRRLQTPLTTLSLEDCSRCSSIGLF
jgi:hypothetical protein